MTSFKFLRASAVACFAAMFMCAAADAQPPGGGPREGGFGQRGGRGEGGRGEGGRGQRGGGPGQGGGPGGQRGGFGRGGGGSGFGRGGSPTIGRATLLGLDDVRDELNIDEAQGATIDAAIDAYREERSENRPDFSAIRDMSEEERKAFFEKMQKDREALAKKTNETLNLLLEDEQRERLDQIEFQLKARGNVLALLKADEDIRKKLKVTDEQITKMEEAAKASEEAMSKLRDDMRAQSQNGGDRPDFNEIREKFDSIRKESEKKVAGVLTEEQNQMIAKMKGEPFELDLRALMRGAGGGRGGAGGGRGGFGGPGGGGPGGGRGGFGGGRPGGDRGGERGGRGEGGGERRRPAIESDDSV